MKTIKFLSILILSLVVISCSKFDNNFSETVFYDDFNTYPEGRISKPVGAHTEYHYLKESNLNPTWKISTFYHSRSGADTACYIAKSNGKKSIFSDHTNKMAFTHPMVVTGNTLWKDYSVELSFSPFDSISRTGLVFRYVNDRQYYFVGIEKGILVLLSVNHEKEFHVPDERILAENDFQFENGKEIKLRAVCKGSEIKVFLDDKLVFEVIDSLFLEGRIALLADAPAVFSKVEVKTSADEIQRIKLAESEIIKQEESLQKGNPQPVVWKKIKTTGFGVGRNLRFGDLNNDGETDILIGQVVHHAWPRDSYSELSCLTAITANGEILWQTGTPSRDHETLTNDVAFQIIDFDHDGKSEVVYTMNCELIVADGATGKIKLKRKTPEHKSTQNDNETGKIPVKEWDRILGDCLFFCDLRGNGHPMDVVIKNRYTKFWVLDEKLNTQWSAECRTGHYPYSADTDGDGKEELYIGYSAYDWQGNQLWSLDDTLKDHCDGVGVVKFNPAEDNESRIFIAGSDQGAILLNKNGEILKRQLIGHVQNPAIANFRDDLPGLETVTVNFWGNQGIIHFFDSNHTIYHSFEPTQYGSMCLPVNWNGGSEELFVLNANIDDGGLYNGHGQRAVRFPDDGHPDMCNAVLDFIGDGREEIVVWNPDEIWIYTQNDSPKQGDVNIFRKNPLYNYSNYQLTVSEPIK